MPTRPMSLLLRSRAIRRYGPQALLLVSAFATAVLLALVFRPARVGQMAAPVSVQIPAPPEAERAAAQAKLAEAMARLGDAPPAAETPEAAPQPEPPVPSAKAPEPDPPALDKPAPAPAPVLAPAPEPVRLPRLSDADLRRLSDKAAQAMRDGDVYGARLILERAIEGGDANALLTLAETYDPKGLARMNAKSVKPDPARARDLYAQALDKGVAGARAKLDALDR